MDKIKEVMDLVFAFELEISEAAVLEESAKDVYQKADSIRQSIESKLRELLEREPLSDGRLQQIHTEDEFGLFCDYDDFEQIARAIEQEHKIFKRNE